MFSRLQEKHLQDILMRSGKSMEINKEADNMCTALEKLIEDGKKEGMQEGRLTSVKNLMESMGWTAEQAMDALKISQEDRNKYAGMLKKQ